MSNLLWLEISDAHAVTNGWIGVTLHGTTPQAAYDLAYKLALTDPNWTFDQTVIGAEGTDRTLTWISMSGRTNLLLWARGQVDEDGNGLPDWWELKHFGQTGVDANGDLDDDGTSNAQEYQNHTDPNKIVFSTMFVYDHTNSVTATGTIEVQHGAPAMMAVLVNSTNFSSAAWVPFSTGVSVQLGMADGRYDVWLGVRGLSSDSKQSWTRVEVTRDSVPPSVVITSPTNLTVASPFLQLRGYSSEVLRTLSYDIANGTGTLTNQAVFTLDKHFDTNIWDFTTNTFQAFDVELTNGLNVITLRVADLAGNTTVTNLSVTLDYSTKTNPPAVELFWPLDGTQIAASNFTFRGWTEDCASTLSATIIGSGETNVLEGLVERDGNFWIEGMPLAAGTNSLALTVTDAAGNSTITNLNVLRSAMALVVNAISESSLWNTNVDLTGTISTNGYTVWANGVKATNDSGVWFAHAVPITPGGTAVFQVRAISNADNGGNGTGGSGGTSASYQNSGNPASSTAPAAEIDPEKPVRLYVESYSENDMRTRKTEWIEYDAVSGYEVCWGKFKNEAGNGLGWEDGLGGGGSAMLQSSGQNCEGSSDIGPCNMVMDWPPTFWPDLANGIRNASGNCDWNIMDPTENIQPADVRIERCGVADQETWSGLTEHLLTGTIEDWTITEQYTRSAETRLKLFTGGKSRPGRQSLFVISAYAVQFLRNPTPLNISYSAARQIPPESITIDDKHLGSDSLLYLVLPENATVDVTPRVGGVSYYTNSLTADKHRLRVLANSYLLGDDRVRPLAHYCVGEFISFTPQFLPPVPNISSKRVQWIPPGKFVNEIQDPIYSDSAVNYRMNLDLLSHETTSAWWVSGGFGEPTYSINVRLDLTFGNGQEAGVPSKGKFTMHPMALNVDDNHVVGTSPVYGACASIDRLRVYAPAFYTVQVESKTPFSGKAVSTQLLTGSMGSDTCNPLLYPGTWLDNVEYYTLNGHWEYPVTAGPIGHIENMVLLLDSPGINCQDGGSRMYLDFSDYVRFKPDAGPGPNIYITLGLVSWHAHGSTTLQGSPPDYAPAPTHDNELLPTSDSDANMDGAVLDFDLFPWWEHTAHNYSP